MTFKIFLHKNADKFLKKLDEKTKKHLIELLRKLKDYPNIELDVVKIAGEKDTFRLRFGKFRALFKVYESEKIIVVIKIDLRRRVYRNLP